MQLMHTVDEQVCACAAKKSDEQVVCELDEGTNTNGGGLGGWGGFLALFGWGREVFGVWGNKHTGTFPVGGSAESAKPLCFGLLVEAYAGVVEPLDGAVVVVACDHLVKGDLVAVAVSWFGGVVGHIRDIGTHHDWIRECSFASTCRGTWFTSSASLSCWLPRHGGLGTWTGQACCALLWGGGVASAACAPAACTRSFGERRRFSHTHHGVSNDGVGIVQCKSQSFACTPRFLGATTQAEQNTRLELGDVPIEPSNVPVNPLVRRSCQTHLFLGRFDRFIRRRRNASQQIHPLRLIHHPRVTIVRARERGTEECLGFVFTTCLLAT